MAPSLEEPVVASSGVDHPIITKKAGVNGNKLQYTPGRTPVEKHDNYAHEDLLPSFPDLHWEPLGEIPYTDKGLLGDPNFSNLLSSATDIFDYTPKLGTEVHGVNLARLTDAQKNDLARLISHRGVVFFRGQDDLDIDAQRELGRYFGSLHKVSWTYFFFNCYQITDPLCSMLLLLFLAKKGSRMFTSSILATTLSISAHCLRPASCGTRMYVYVYMYYQQYMCANPS